MNESYKIPMLFAYPEVAAMPRVELVAPPTSVENLENLEKNLDCEALFVKRDDLTNEIYGGNKCRKLEYLIGDALSKGSSGILTFGGIGSNHKVANTIFCKQFGLKSHIFISDQPNRLHCRKYLKVNYYCGADFHYSTSF